MKSYRFRIARYQMLSLLLLCWSANTSAEDCENPAGKLVSVEGDVSISDRLALANQTICSGETINVGALSRAAIRLETTQTVVRIDQNSTFVINPSDTGHSWLELVKGVIYLFSRQPESLRVDTPYLNAAIDGTEFVIMASNELSEVTVIEGSVLASNTSGEIRLMAGEQASTRAGAALKRRVVVDPVDAVQWALHYPKIGATENTSENVRSAADLLTRGDVERAEALLKDNPDVAVALALKAIIAVTRNRLIEATRLAEEAVNSDSESSVAYTALSDVQQTHFRTEPVFKIATENACNATGNINVNALQAELNLSAHKTEVAQESVVITSTSTPNCSRSNTTLGCAISTGVTIEEPKTAFVESAARVFCDPFRCLGLALTTTRNSRLVEARGNIEFAAASDHNSSLARGYPRKEDAEEQLFDDASTRFTFANEFGPNDSTYRFINVLLEEVLNVPMCAYKNIIVVRNLIDNRLIDQPALLMNKSASACSFSNARINTNLSLEQPAVNDHTNSTPKIKITSSAYRVLDDSYGAHRRNDSVPHILLVQAAILQGMLINPVQV